MSQASFMNTLLPKVLKFTELIGLFLTGLGLLFKILHYPGANEMLMIGLMTLAGTYFISAFVIVQDTATKPKGLPDMLVPILRKMMFIGLSVYSIAFLFGLLNLNGANEMNIIGMGTMVVCTGGSMFLILGKRERMKMLQAPFLRCIAVLGIYVVILLFH